MNSGEQKEKIIINHNMRGEIKEVLKYKKILYFYSQTGWGKTSVITTILQDMKKNYDIFSAYENEVGKRVASSNKKIIIIDDFHSLEDEQDIYLISDKIMNSDFNTTFIILSRAEAVSWLKPYIATGQIKIYNQSFFEFGISDIKEMLMANNLDIENMDINRIIRSAKGYPLAIRLVIDRLLRGETLDSNLIEKSKIDIYGYFDFRVFGRFDENLQRFLLQISLFEEFNADMSEMVTGRHDAIDMINECLKYSSFLSWDITNTYRIQNLFREYLMYTFKKRYSEDAMAHIYHNAALYYELKDDISNALKYYTECKEYEKISELLIINANKNPGNGHYYETEKYYKMLPKEEILKSPVLMSGMSMLCSMWSQVEESDYWYTKLKDFASTCNKEDSNYKVAISKVYYLDIALPHKGSSNIASLIVKAAKIMITNNEKIQEFSVTSNMPSLLNGGKDFCIWMKHDRQLHQNLRGAVEKVLGKFGVGLADIALGESLLVKDSEDKYEIMFLLNKGLMEAEKRGNIEIRFVAVALTARLFVSQGRMDTALSILNEFKIKVKEKNNNRLLLNLNAFIVKLYMVSGDNAYANEWLTEEAPDEKKDFYILDRYKYLVKARAYMVNSRYLEAMVLLDRLLDYSEKYDRPYIDMEVNLLKGIILYRQKLDNWMEPIRDAIKISEQFELIRPVAEFGVSLIEPLKKAMITNVDKKFLNRIKSALKEQALLYPKYLQQENVLTDSLTAVERNVLRLICAGEKNDDIGKILEISGNTVKFHVKNIYNKLNVNNRVKAIQAAKDMQLI